MQNIAEKKEPFALAENEAAWVIDASAAGLSLGILRGGKWLYFRAGQEGEETLAALSAALREALSRAHLSWGEISAALFCEGTGCVLGIRLAAMALKTWMAMAGGKGRLRAAAWKSLPFAAACIAGQSGQKKEAFCVASPSRQGLWNAYFPDTQKWEECAAGALAPRKVYALKQRKIWGDWPQGWTLLEQGELLEKNVNLLFKEQLLRACEKPDVFVVRAAEYKKWNSA